MPSKYSAAESKVDSFFLWVAKRSFTLIFRFYSVAHALHWLIGS